MHNYNIGVIYSLTHLNISFAFKKTFIEHLLFAGTSKVIVLSLLLEAGVKSGILNVMVRSVVKISTGPLRQSQGLLEFSVPELGHSKGPRPDFGQWYEWRQGGGSWELVGSQNRHDLVTG